MEVKRKGIKSSNSLSFVIHLINFVVFIEIETHATLYHILITKKYALGVAGLKSNHIIAKVKIDYNLEIFPLVVK